MRGGSSVSALTLTRYELGRLYPVSSCPVLISPVVGSMVNRTTIDAQSHQQLLPVLLRSPSVDNDLNCPHGRDVNVGYKAPDTASE